MLIQLQIQTRMLKIDDLEISYVFSILEIMFVEL